MSDSSLSSAPLGDLEKYTNTTVNARSRLDNYQATVNQKGETNKFKELLQACFRFFPPEERQKLAQDILPMRTNSTPDALHPQQSSLRQRCLKQGGYRCAITGTRDPGSVTDPNDPAWHLCSRLHFAHILPFAIGEDEGEQAQIYKIWKAIFYYFPALEDAIDAYDVNRGDNVFMIDWIFHEDFGHFRLVLEPTETPNCYKARTFPNFQNRRHLHFLSGIFTFTDYDNKGQYALPNPRFLHFHASMRHIPNASGLAEVYDQVLRDFDEIGCLSEDEQANVGVLLSISSKLMNWDDARRGGHPD